VLRKRHHGAGDTSWRETSWSGRYRERQRMAKTEEEIDGLIKVGRNIKELTG
jgi:hypothetical protein